MNHLSLGKIGESTAANYLIALGYEIVQTNYFNPKGYRIGEIDIVAKDRDGKIIFVEVKSRKGRKGEVVPEENITPNKLKKIYKAINFYLARNKMIETDWRLDLIAIILDYSTRKMDIRHIKSIHL